MCESLLRHLSQIEGVPTATGMVWDKTDWPVQTLMAAALGRPFDALSAWAVWTYNPIQDALKWFVNSGPTRLKAFPEYLRANGLDLEALITQAVATAKDRRSMYPARVDW